MSQTLLELKRSQNINITKQSDNYDDTSQGKNRYFRRMHSQVQQSVQQLNRLDMNKLFHDGILDINLDVRGETDTYIVRISFGKFLAELHKQVMQQENRLTLMVITRALVQAFNTDDILVRCSCPDFMYRQAYWLSMDGGIAGEMETRASDKTNPDDTKGRGCKHIQAALTNNAWLQRTARVIMNYINYMKDHYEGMYAEIIYPAIFEKDYDEIYQQDLDIMSKDDLRDAENSEVQDDSDIIDTSNKWAREKGRFQPGNEYRYQTNSEDPNQLELNFDEPEKQYDIDNEAEEMTV